MAQERVSRIGVSPFRNPLGARVPASGGMLAKTSRPRLSAAYPRNHLFEVLDLARTRHAATLVIGPPGAGKTTLVSSYLESRNLACLWYQIDSGDDDVARFFYYFTHAAPLPPSEAPALPAFDPGGALDLAKFSRHYFREFFAALEEPLAVVLDNYEQLAADSPLQQVLRIACEETPSIHHVILVSRNDCPESLVRMRLNRALTVIDAQDLALTLDETQGIADLHGVKLPSAAAKLAVHTRSAGWMMGLILMLECIRRDTPQKPNPVLRAGQEELLFDYFAEEVLKTVDSSCRNLLLQMALLPEMTVHRVTQLTGTPRAAALLLEMMRKNCFVSRYEAAEAAYQFHPLFREFLLGQAERELGPGVAVYRRKAAEVLAGDGDYEAALSLLEKASDWRRLGDLILEIAPNLKAQGRDAALNLWLAKLPAELIGADCWLRYWQGASQMSSDPEAGQAILDDAYRRFRAAGDLVGMALSWSGLTETILATHKDLVQLDAWVAEFDERLGGELGRLPTVLHARVTLAYFNALSFRQPLHPDLPSWLQKVLAMLDSERRAAERALLRYHLVRYHLLRGEHAEAESVLGLLHHADANAAERCPPRQLLDHVSEAIVAFHAGMRERCLHAVDQGLRDARTTGDRLVESDLLQIGAAMSLNRGDVERADSFLAEFERLMEDLPYIDRGAYYAVSAWRRFYLGERPLALELLRRAVAASEARGTAYYIGADHLSYALLLQLCAQPDEARRHLKIGHSTGRSIGNDLIGFVYHLFSAHSALEGNQREAALEHLTQAMQIGRHRGYMHFLVFPPKLIARLCLEALEHGIETVYVRALIERNELTPDPAWRQSEVWPWPIRIYTLGRFSVVQQGSTLRFAGKSQKRPLELLKALIALGGRDVSEARLADALWPESEGDASAQSLATTLFRLRKLLGENAIRRQEGRVTLDPSHCWVDCWEFERVASDELLESKGRLGRLRRLYHGAFLEDLDAPWAERLRERLKARFNRVVSEVHAVFPWMLVQMLVL
jgi:ATP/maltotriose-dependent transcriptional regulator MalT